MKYLNNETKCEDHFVRKIDGIRYRQNVAIEFDIVRVRDNSAGEVYVSNSNSESIINY